MTEDGKVYLGRRTCPRCKTYRRMFLHEEEQAIRCEVCGAEVHARAAKLTINERTDLVSFRTRYEFRNSLDLTVRRERGIPKVQ